MGRRGPKPTPTAILKARGSWLAETRPGEPQVPLTEAAPPDWVDRAVRPHWSRIVKMLHGCGIMSDVHAPALSLLINSLGHYIASEKDVAKHGRWCKNNKGNPIVHPAWRARCGAWEQVLKALREFGMTPSALSAVQAQPDKGKDASGIQRYFKPKLAG